MRSAANDVQFTHVRFFDTATLDLESTGGGTIAYKEMPDGQVIYAAALCSMSDNFSKSRGRVISTGRLIAFKEKLDAGLTLPAADEYGLRAVVGTKNGCYLPLQGTFSILDVTSAADTNDEHDIRDALSSNMSLILNKLLEQQFEKETGMPATQYGFEAYGLVTAPVHAVRREPEVYRM